MSKMEVQTPASTETDWDQVREWDEQYVFHVLATKDEYRSNVVESADGCYVTMADGRRIFDFANQLICVNMGHRHPKIVEAIREATDKFGYVWEGLTTEYRARAAKLIMEDIGVGEWAGRIRFLSTGTEAVENMVLFAKLYTGRRNIVTRIVRLPRLDERALRRQRHARVPLEPRLGQRRARPISTSPMPPHRTTTMRRRRTATGARSDIRIRTARTGTARWRASRRPST